MKILYITAEGFDTPNPNNQMAETMIDIFLKSGYEVHLIQSRRKNINDELPDKLKKRAHFSCDTITRKVIDKSNFIKRYLNDSKYAFQSMKYWKNKRNIDVVYLQSNPTILLPMLLIKIFLHKPIVYSIYDVFPGHAYSIGVIKSKIVYKLLELIQKPCYKIADRITVLSEDMKDKIIAQGANLNRVRVVPPWFDDKNTIEIPKTENRFIQKYKIDEDQFYVQFAGSIGYVFNEKTVLALAEKLQDIPSIVIQIIGDGIKKENMMEQAKKMELNNISFYPLQPLDLVADVYSACDICFIPLMPGVIWSGVPSKAPILMACRKVIVNSVEVNSKYAQLFAEYDMGYAVDIHDLDTLAEKIIFLYKNPKELQRMADNSYKFGQTHYASSLNIQKLINIFKELGS